MKKTKINNNSINSFPNVRLRRLRTTAAVRELLQETRLSPKDLIAPIFVQEGLKKTEEIPSMPDIQRMPLSDRKSTRLNSSHANISYAVFCLKKKNCNPIICE